MDKNYRIIENYDGMQRIVEDELTKEEAERKAKNSFRKSYSF